MVKNKKSNKNDKNNDNDICRMHYEYIYKHVFMLF